MALALISDHDQISQAALCFETQSKIGKMLKWGTVMGDVLLSPIHNMPPLLNCSVSPEVKPLTFTSSI